jgi:two-component system, NtrC family, response regulator AtoC
MSENAALILASSERSSLLHDATSALDLRATSVGNVSAALEALGKSLFEVVLADLDVEGVRDAAIELLRGLGRVSPGVPVVVIGPAGSGERAAQLVELGAADFLEEPVSLEQVSKALEHARAAGERQNTGSPRPVGSPGILGESKPMQHVKDVLRRAAPGLSTILIRGESGTGKELVARLVHEMSPRSMGPFVKVHCAALPDTLLESELFGYERGAFTGAVSRKPGRVELAQKGTLFLDEIGDITLAMQVKLLRLLQDREFERLGGTDVVRADVRFVAATHRDLDGMVKRGEFREDLFYRLNVVTLWIPPLRTRRDDVPLLARRFCGSFSELNGRPELQMAPDALVALRSMRWPGNVRQLQNFVEKLVVLSEGTAITAADVERELSQENALFSTQSTGGLPIPSGRDEKDTPHTAGEPTAAIVPLGEQIRQTERLALIRALEHTKGNRSLAARVLGVSRATLYKKLQEHEIE